MKRRTSGTEKPIRSSITSIATASSGWRQFATLTIATVVDPTTGETVLTIHDGIELFPTDKRSPDLVLYGNDGYLTSTALKPDQFTDSGGGWSTLIGRDLHLMGTDNPSQ